jgi:integrase
MPKIPDFNVVETPRGWMVSVPPMLSSTGKRKRKYWKTKTEAKTFAGKVRETYKGGVRGGMIDAALAMDARRAAEVLEGTGISLMEAARIAKAKLGNAADRETFKVRYDRALAGGEEHWSDRYKLDMDRIPRWVPESFMKKPCGGIDRETIIEALQKAGPKKASTLHKRAALIMAALGFQPRHRKTTEVSILTKDQKKALLAACEGAEERRLIALLLYAGIRPDASNGEIRRLKWEDVGAVSIYVPADTSKTNSDRLIPMSPVLKKELEGRPKKGLVAPAGWKKTWQRIRKDAGISHMQDVTRHTFASHFLMWKGEDACKAAMGHTANSSTLFRHYRRAVTKAAAVRYFSAASGSR